MVAGLFCSERLFHTIAPAAANGIARMTKATWYFDFVSPFSYLQFARFGDLPADLEFTMKPILFSALLEHWEHKGPAEISTKRKFVYRFFKWQADKRGIPFRMPPRHPFNPLPALRLALIKGADRRTVEQIFAFIYAEGRNVEGEKAIAELGQRLGLANAVDRLSDPQIKDALRTNTDAAIADGVFGVPTFLVDTELFWGDDATDMLLDYLANRDLFKDEEMMRLSNMPMGLERTAS